MPNENSNPLLTAAPLPAFSRFEERGVMDSQSGREFLPTAAGQSGARDALELFMVCRGREPTVAALLRRAGLVTSEATA